MTKEEYGELLKYLGILRYAILKKIPFDENFDIKNKVIEAVNILLLDRFILEQIMDI